MIISGSAKYDLMTSFIIVSSFNRLRDSAILHRNIQRLLWSSLNVMRYFLIVTEFVHKMNTVKPD